MFRFWRSCARSAPTPLLLLLLALAAVLTGCGDDDTRERATGDEVATTAVAAASEQDDVDEEGVLRLPFDLTSPAASFDPHGVTTPFYWHFAVYDTLLRSTDDNTYEPGLAKSATIVDPSTIEVELRADLLFQDGTALDSEAVKATIERNAASEKSQIFRLAELSQIESIDVDSPTEFTIRLASPTAGSFYNLLAHGETMPVSPKAVADGVDLRSNPVGAGPFKVESFDAPNSVKLVKWDGYFDADRIRLAGIEFVHVSNDPAAQVNAMRTHAIDGMGGWSLSLDTLNQLGGDVSTRSRKSPDGTLFVSLQCDTFSPFQDVKVRQALNFATDKEALNDLLLEGKGEPMSQFWSSDAKWYEPDIADAYDFDPERARGLLAETGVSDLQFKIATIPGQNQKIAEVLQAQWSEVGISVSLVPVRDPVTEYYINKQQEAFIVPQNRTWSDKITRNFAPGSVGNVCDPRSDEFTTSLNALRAADPASPEAVDAWSDVSSYLSKNPPGVFLLINLLNYAWDDERIGNVTWAPDQAGLRYLDWNEVYIKE